MSIEKIVKSNLCTGCGVCISEDKTGKSSMVWNSEGFYIPQLGDGSDSSMMEAVCPFNLNNNKIDEDSLANDFLSDAFNKDPDIGAYCGIYAGYSKEYRETSSSGGLATYVFENLLRNKHVDNLFVVSEVEGRFAYQLFNDADQIKNISKTRYYPVTLESLFYCLGKINGTVAVSGIACFIKAIRLKQYYNPELKSKIPFLIGIICGGLKSKYYTDFLAQSSGCKNDYKDIQYRVKNAESFALDYKFSCHENDSNRIHVVNMQSLGDMWGSGLFKSNACDFCDDVTTELADISLGDAWIPPYNKDGLGNSVIITRSPLADTIINSGLKAKELKLDVLSLSKMKSSQQGSFNHRHKGLLYRVNYAKKNKRNYPAKRERFLTKQSFLSNCLQYMRLKTRSRSLQVWCKYKDVFVFRKKMKNHLYLLKLINKLNHKFNRLLSVLNKRIN